MIFFGGCFRTRFPSESRWLDIASETISMLKGTPERLQKSSERYVSRCLNSLAIPSDELDGCLTMKNGLSDQISSICLKIPLDLVFVRKLNWSLLDPPPPSHEDSENNVRVSGVSLAEPSEPDVTKIRILRGKSSFCAQFDGFLRCFDVLMVWNELRYHFEDVLVDLEAQNALKSILKFWKFWFW